MSDLGFSYRTHKISVILDDFYPRLFIPPHFGGLVDHPLPKDLFGIFANTALRHSDGVRISFPPTGVSANKKNGTTRIRVLLNTKSVRTTHRPEQSRRHPLYTAGRSRQVR